MEKCVIKLIIKATNELDQTIVCNVNWSVGQLKEYLSKVYPNKPKPINQNLFYYGKLLDNSAYLKNIFQNCEKNEKFIIHLIFKLNLSNSFCNYEKEFVDTANRSNSMEEVKSSWETITSTQLLSHQYNYLNENQVAWIQQAYEHYLSHYMQLLTVNGFQIASTFWCSQTLKFTSLNVNNTVTSNPVTNEDQQQQIILYRADITNFNNQINNNNINNNIDNGRDDMVLGNNRDWLDNFYMLSRIIILISIVYFYSSPLRFIIVTFSGFLIYLYHHGFFNTHQFVLTDNNNAHVENNNQIEQNGQNLMPPIQHLQQNQLINTNNFPVRTYRNNENDLGRPGALSFTWIFFSSFFASLVPDQPNIS